MATGEPMGDQRDRVVPPSLPVGRVAAGVSTAPSDHAHHDHGPAPTTPSSIPLRQTEEVA